MQPHIYAPQRSRKLIPVGTPVSYRGKEVRQEQKQQQQKPEEETV